MNKINKIALIGNCGSGKSTLAVKLNEILDLPVYHFDQYYWLPNWRRPDINEYGKVHNNICDRENWITDGINLKFFTYRLERADVIIFLDIPRYICLYRIFKRTLKYYGQVTPSSAPQCTEKISWNYFKFLKWVWDFKSSYRSKIYELLNQYKNKKQIYIIKSEKDIIDLINKLKAFQKKEEQ